MPKPIVAYAARGIVCERVIVEPEALLAFARGRRVDADLRAQFAAVRLKNKRHGN